MITDFNFNEGVKRIWTEFEDYQTKVIKAILSDYRKIEDEEYFQYIKSLGCFFSPNDEFLTQMLGVLPMEYTNSKLLIPMRDFSDRIFNFIAYDGDTPELKYQYPNKYQWRKDKYMFITREQFKKAMEEEYICIVDGIFDQISLQQKGINAVSLCGSSLTEYHKHYLAFIKNKIVLPDNDKAGKKLVWDCTHELENCHVVKQGKEWDIDDYIKNTQDLSWLLQQIDKIKNQILA